MPSAVPDSIAIGRAVLDDIAAHARAEAPNECCGLLVGSLPYVETTVRARNVRAWRSRMLLRGSISVRRMLALTRQPLRYLIDPRDHFAAIKLARAMGRSVVGAYHSHPGAEPVPSATDLAEALDPTLVYLIVSTATGNGLPDIRAWRLEPGGFRQLELVAEP